MKPFDFDLIMRKHGGIAVTRNGRKARLFHKCAGTGVILGVTTREDGIETPHTWQCQGNVNHSHCSSLDLFTPVEKIQREYWMNIYRGSTIPAYLHSSREQADMNSLPGRIACVHTVIDCEEGEGL